MPVRNGLTITVALCALTFGIGGALGQGSQQERAACRGDVKRFCQSELQKNPDDMLSVGNCLQVNRARLSRGCRNVFVSHGQ
jgi:hypothetical protein